MFFIEKSEETTFKFSQILWVSYKIETQNVTNLLNDSINEGSKFVTKNGIL